MMREALSVFAPPPTPLAEDMGSSEREGVDPKSSIFRYSVVALAEVGSNTEARGSPTWGSGKQKDLLKKLRCQVFSLN